MVRMWRVSGVLRLWHVQRDAFKNLGYPSLFLDSGRRGVLCIGKALMTLMGVGSFHSTQRLGKPITRGGE